MLSTLLSERVIAPECFHLQQPISGSSWNRIGDVSNLQELWAYMKPEEA